MHNSVLLFTNNKRLWKLLWYVTFYLPRKLNFHGSPVIPSSMELCNTRKIL